MRSWEPEEPESRPLTKQELHTRISYWKSGLRIAGCLGAWLAINNLGVAVVILSALLLLAEILGVAEEVWGA